MPYTPYPTRVDAVDLDHASDVNVLNAGLGYATAGIANVLETQYAGGAKGDGVTDDSAAINAALATGLNVYLPAGTYLVSAPLVIATDGQVLFGASMHRSIIKAATGMTGDVIQLGIYNNGAVQIAHAGISTLKIDGSSMAGTVADQGNLIRTWNSIHGFISDVWCRSSKNYGLRCDGEATGVIGYNNTYRRMLFDVGAGGVYNQNSEADGFIDCRFINHSGTLAAAQAGTTAGSICKLTTGYCYVEDCIFGNGGAYTLPTLELTNGGPCRIIGNRFDQSRYMAIDVYAGAHIIVGNQFGNCSKIGTQEVIRLGSGGNIVADNMFDATNGTIHYTYCVSEPSAQAGNIICHNRMLAGTSGFVHLNAASTNARVYGNIGANPAGLLTPPTIPASGTALQNNSGYDATVNLTGGTVTAVAIGGTTLTGVTGGILRVPAGQTITLTYSAAPAWQWIGD